MLSGTGQLDYFDNHTYMYTNYTENCCLQTSCLYNCPRKGLHHFQRRAYLACPAYSMALMLNFPIGFEKCLRTLLFNILVTYTWQNKYTISFNYWQNAYQRPGSRLPGCSVAMLRTGEEVYMAVTRVSSHNVICTDGPSSAFSQQVLLNRDFVA